MSSSGDDLRLIRDRGPGWEAAWSILFGEVNLRLLRWVKNGQPNDPASGRLNRTHFGVLGNVFEADDFISEYLLWLHSRATDGRLLAGYDIEAGTDVCAYLIRMAPQRAVSHMRKRRRHVPIDGTEALQGGSGGSRWMGDVARGLTEIEHPKGEPVGAVVRQAAMQVHPRLDRTVENFPTLEGDLQRAMRPEDHASGLQHLEARHADSQERLRAELESIQDELAAMAAPKARHQPHTQRHWDNRFFRRFADLLIAPLDQEAVMALLDLPAAAARKQVSRYRRRENLRRLFPRLRKLVELDEEGRFDWLLEDADDAGEDSE
jgi:DNA-directed RNA polymerase specialized sigma24 family protein